MILQALNDYYARKAADPRTSLAPEGFEVKAIPFVLVIDADGRLLQLADRREGVGKKKEAKAELVPQGAKKTSGVAANLLWDTAEYVLGVDTRGKPDRVAEQHQAFVKRFVEAFGGDPEDAGLRAVKAFLERHVPSTREDLSAHPAGAEIMETNPLLSFQLQTDAVLVCQRPAVVAALQAGQAGQGAPADGICLVSGEADVIERLHPSIKGVWGAQTSGANIVSFNLDAFSSYGKTQSFNAPVGSRAAFAYTTALNHLLSKGSRQRIQVGDASTVFWAEKESGAPFETAFLDFLDARRDDCDPDRGTQAVASLYACVRDGRPFTTDDLQRFHVLGLSPNAARIAIRFWHVASIRELATAFLRHFGDLEIDRPGYEAAAPLSLYRLLSSTALQGKAENIAPNLGGDVMRAILKALPYPETLMQGALRRIRAEREVGFPRAALLKAYLIRNCQDKEITVSLNPENIDPGYCLGRLFAALERVQERAQGNLNASIRDRYYGAFSTTPTTVLPMLMRLKNHHLAKLPNRGEAVNLEKLLAEIVDGLADVPARLSLTEQCRFAVGYYHQRQSFFNRADAQTADQPATSLAE
ncbi:MAG: type I-C CRISPR-associated protein Cas8c/Csd1 [Candidatus Accumulibacter sp.]|uniref:type I-C CRISPR-associated protein Cas8c/Csd1 n=1 Tax=Accumulibacter sp. TaxID=2053492 RepID=UPI00260104CB|nr:type I-C CRISPR-associated protein Cas8c/Csd1 [Accumulibacter sp.]MCP5249057.1 type I-C CRISPR-associated protein Cas8c/Csd1 [Accumulibacter sp.]